jgi:integrase
LKREKHARRDRRLIPDELDKDGKVKVPGEERRLLAAANPWLQRLIIAVLETGCWRGERLSLQWQDVSLTRNELTIRAEKPRTETHAPCPSALASRPSWS